MTEFVTQHKIKPVSKDVLYVEMFWIIQVQRKAITGIYFKKKFISIDVRHVG